MDSIPIDSTQLFKTLKGRTVYGGGGVMPDLFIPTDTLETSAYLTDLFFSGTLIQFAFNVADRERARLLAQYRSSEDFARRYTVGSALLAELERFATKEGIEHRPADAQRSREQIAMRIKAGIARNVWGDDGYYRIMLQKDRTYQQARKELVEHPEVGAP
jgi:carboxyl-terminal processing protease